MFDILRFYHDRHQFNCGEHNMPLLKLNKTTSNKHFLPTVYIHLKRNRLCLREYSSKRTIRHHFVCNSLFMRRRRVLVCCVRRAFFFVCVCFGVCAPDRIQFSHILTFSNVLWDMQQVYVSSCNAVLYRGRPICVFQGRCRYRLLKIK